MVPNAVKKKVIALPAFCDILLGVIDHAIRANRSDHVHIPGTAYARHLCAGHLGDLHCESAHTSRRAVNQNALSRLYSSFVAKAVQGSECRHGCWSSLRKRHVI